MSCFNWRKVILLESVPHDPTFQAAHGSGTWHHEQPFEFCSTELAACVA